MVNVTNLNSALVSGLQGFQSASNQVVDASLSIAQGSDNLTSDLISLTTNSINAQAAAKVIDVADETLGSLIDTFA